MKGLGPAVIGILAVSLVKLVPHALPDPFAIVILIATLAALLYSKIGAMTLIPAGGVMGVLLSRVSSIPGVKAATSVVSP